MDGPDRLELFNEFQVADGFEILHRDTLVVLGTTGEDLAGLLGVKGGERRVGPFVGLGGDGVEVGVEEYRRERRVGARPS